MSEQQFVVNGRTYRTIDQVRARMSSRAKLILGFVLIDAVITLGIIWWLMS